MKLIYNRWMNFSFVHKRNIISIYPIVDLYGGIARNLQVIVGKTGRKSSSSCIFYLGRATRTSLGHITRLWPRTVLLDIFLLKLSDRQNSWNWYKKKFFDLWQEENCSETDCWPRWVAHACSTLSNLDRYSHKIILY